MSRAGAPATTGDAELLRRVVRSTSARRHSAARAGPSFAPRQIERGLAIGTCWLWTVDGAAVSFAYRHATVNGVARIGPVYTPPALARRGYGSAVTAAAAREILDEGAVPCLFTDLANPTSNRIYQALGFRPSSTGAAVRFELSQSRNAANEYGRPRKSATRSAASLLPPGASTRSR